MLEGADHINLALKLREEAKNKTKQSEKLQQSEKSPEPSSGHKPTLSESENKKSSKVRSPREKSDRKKSKKDRSHSEKGRTSDPSDRYKDGNILEPEKTKTLEKRSRPSGDKNSKIEKEEKLKIADLFVKVLVPRLKSGEIGSKEIFKVLARELTHRVLEVQGPKAQIDDVKVIVKKFFDTNKKILDEKVAKSASRSFNF